MADVTVPPWCGEINACLTLISRGTRKTLLVSGLLTLIGGLGGCSSIAYYHQAVSGQMALLMQREPIPDVLADEATDSVVKARLEYVQAVLGYAETAGLPVGGSYGDYVDLGRAHVVWNVYAAPEFSLRPHTFCYVIVGCLAYKGFFAESDARELADEMDANGFDTWVGGVAAYSTLGWFDDPVLSTFVQRSEAQLAALLFHELAHKVVFVKGDTAFNEGFATAVEGILLREWLLSRNEAAAFDEYLASNARREVFIALVLAERGRLDTLYTSHPADAARSSRQTLLAQKARIIKDLRAKYRTLVSSWKVDPYQGWMAAPINNARLSNVATYNELVPAFRALYADAGSMAAYFQRVEQLAGLDGPTRSAQLEELLKSE